MKILLGSKNPSKKNSLSIALNTLGIKNYEIECFEVDSNVSSKPIGYEIIKGIDNRNVGLNKIACTHSIDYDYICSIEGGFEKDQSGQYFIITYCGFIGKNGDIFYGKSQGFPITQSMFNYIYEGKSLNFAIEQITGIERNKHSSGITGYLSNDILIREIFDSQAVLSALMKIVFQEQFDKLNNKVKKR